MNLTGGQLEAQYVVATSLWPFLRAVEVEHDLPPFLLFAVGSRETGLRRAFTQGSTGDGGHGHGLFQLDDRWHVIPDGFDTDAHTQAELAATMLAGFHVVTDDWVKALNRYNSGQDSNEATTGGDYGPDVWERQAYLEKHFSGTIGGHVMQLVGREEWGARAPNATTPIGAALHGVACHWEGPQLGTPMHRSVGMSLAGPERTSRIAAALTILHAERQVGLGLLSVQSTATPQAVINATAVVSSADCYELVAGIQAYHMDTMGWNDIAYNGILCPHGYVFEGRGPGVRSGANGDATVNSTHYALCSLSGEGDPFTDRAKDAFNDGAVWLGVPDGEWVGHRDLTSTACPGEEIYAWVHSGHPRANTIPTEEDDLAGSEEMLGHLNDQLTFVNQKLQLLVEADHANKADSVQEQILAEIQTLTAVLTKK